jgi:hypothetical protein
MSIYRTSFGLLACLKALTMTLHANGQTNLPVTGPTTSLSSDGRPSTLDARKRASLARARERLKINLRGASDEPIETERE